MSIIKSLADLAINSACMYIADENSEKAIVERNNFEHIIFIREKRLSLKRKLTVSDSNKNKKYFIESDLLKHKYPSMYLYNSDYIEIGEIRLRCQTKTNILFDGIEEHFKNAKENLLDTYEVYINFKKIGTVKYKPKVKLTMELEFNGWKIERNILKDSFIVLDKCGEEIIKCNSAIDCKEVYVLMMNNKEDELYALLIFMLIDLIKNKSELQRD